MNRKIIPAILVLAVSVSAFMMISPYGDAVDTVYEDGAWSYKLDSGGNAIITLWYPGAEDRGVTDGVLTVPEKVQGSGDTQERTVVEIKGVPMQKSYFDHPDVKEIVLPPTVRSLTGDTFRGCVNLMKIDLTNVTDIQSYAFKGCSSLKDVTMPASTFKMSGLSHFEGTAIEHISILNLKEGTTIASFWNCTSLESIEMPSATYRINGLGFNNCRSLKSIDLSGASETIGGFENCTSLETVIPPTSEYRLLSGSFNGCTSLKILDLGNISAFPHSDGGSGVAFISSGIEEFKVGSDSNYSVNDGMVVSKDGKTLVKFPPAKAKEYQLPGIIEEIDAWAFCQAGLTKVDLNATKVVGERAFANCGELVELISPNLKIVNRLAFEKCYSLKSTDLSAVITASAGAFLDCTGLETVDVSLMQDIGYAFSGCTSLKEFTVKDSSMYSAINGILFNTEQTRLLKVPPAWDRTSFAIPENVTELGDLVFFEYALLESIDLNNVTKIGDRAFYSCVSLKNINLKDVEVIGDYTFYGCVELVNIDLSDVTEIGIGTFYGCTSIKTVELDNFIEVKEDTFYGCVSLEMMDLSRIISIGDNAFRNCKKLQSVDMINVLYVGDNAFNGCETFLRAIAPNAGHVGDNAFSSCSSLIYADISGAETAGVWIFNGCANLIAVDVSSADFVSIGKCVKLEEIKTPQKPFAFGGVTSSVIRSIDLTYAISLGTLQECFMLERVIAPNATSLGRNAFTDCTNLSAVYLPNVTDVEYYTLATFTRCSNLEVVYMPKMDFDSSAAHIPPWFLDCPNIKRLIVAGAEKVLDADGVKIRGMYITSDYEEGLIPAAVPKGTTIYRHADAAGWDESYGVFHYVTYKHGEDTVMVDAVPDGLTAAMSLPLPEGKVWFMDDREYNFSKPVTSDITLTEGTVQSVAEDNDSPGDDNTMRILAAVASIVSIVVIAAIFIMRRPA